MKIFVTTIIALITVSFMGCWNMYNDANEDMEKEYQFFLSVFNSPSVGSRTQSTLAAGQDGILSPVYTSSVISTTGSSPATSPNGEYIYVLDPDTSKLNIYKTNDDGTLTYLSNADTLSTARLIKVHPSGKYVYVANSWAPSYSISMYIVNADGTLTSNGAGTIAMTYKPGRMDFHPTGNYLYVALMSDPSSYSSYLESFTVNNDGTLSVLESTITVYTEVSTSVTTQDVLVHPGGKYLYTQQDSTRIIKCDIGNDGVVGTKTSAAVLSQQGVHLAIHPSGNYLYAVGIYYLYAFQITQADGTLSLITSVDTPNSENEAIVHPNGKYLYKTDYSFSNIQCFTIASNGSIDLINMTDYTLSPYTDYPSIMAFIKKKKTD